jgi:hypothetical protein
MRLHLPLAASARWVCSAAAGSRSFHRNRLTKITYRILERPPREGVFLFAHTGHVAAQEAGFWRE